MKIQPAGPFFFIETSTSAPLEHRSEKVIRSKETLASEWAADFQLSLGTNFHHPPATNRV